MPAAALASMVSKLNPRQKLLLKVAGGCLVPVLLVYLVRLAYLPVLGTISERRSTLMDLEVKLADSLVLGEKLLTYEEQLRDAQKRYDTLQGWISTGESMARILESLGQQAKAHRLELVTVQSPSADEPKVITLVPGFDVREVPLNLSLTGRYANIGEFLGELATAPYLASIRSLTMSKPQAESGRLKTDVVLGVLLAEGISK